MRRSPLRRRSRLSPRSIRGADYEDEYRLATLQVKERSTGRCEIVAAHDCDGISTGSPHHRKLRSQGGTNAVDNLLDVCFTGHHWLHRELPRSEAVRLGLIIPRDRPEEPYQGGGR